MESFISFIGSLREYVAIIIKDYQSLIAGLLAIAAALITARPVWKQIQLMNVQTNTVYRDFVDGRAKQLATSRSEWAARFRKFEEETLERIDHENEDPSYDSHWAFDKDHECGALIEIIKKHSEASLDQPTIVEGFKNVEVALERLQDTFDDIHRPLSMDQHDADRSFTDDEWSGIQSKSVESSKSLSEKALDFLSAVRELDVLFHDEHKLMADRVRQTDVLLIKSKL